MRRRSVLYFTLNWSHRVVLYLFLLFAVSWFMISCGNIRLGKDYRTANRASAEMAPDPGKTPEAVIQIYAARAFNWRGIFST